MSDNIVLVKNAFDETPATSPVTSPVLSTAGLERPDLVEIGTLFDTIAIHDSLVHIANTNELNMTWKELQSILNSLIAEQCKLAEENVKDETAKTMVESLTAKITYSINEHNNCPFTIQRLCELLIEPKKYYKMFVKYLRAIDKVLSVTSYWEDFVSTEEKKNEDENMDIEKAQDENMEEEKIEEEKVAEKTEVEKMEEEKIEEEKVAEKAEEEKADATMEEKTDETMEEKVVEKEEAKTDEVEIGEKKIDKEEIEENKIEKKSSLPVDDDLDQPRKCAKMDLD
ncbi:PPP4R2-domain-containing protein [Helicostylum pulchrum]|nr:PPP4R2-domain-containing protein [Helicostylum pulchrum]